MNVVRFRAGERRYLAVDAEQYVSDRASFAARHCDPGTGVAPPEDAQSGLIHVDQGVSGPHGGPDSMATDGPDGEGPQRMADAEGAFRASGPRPGRGSDGVLFLALEPRFRPPRVVATLVGADGERTACPPPALRSAARWAADRADADRVMVDTQAGTRAARVQTDGAVSVESADGGEGGERGPVVREFATTIDWADP